ncbi:MAG TPA: head GIN domain-containing protein [Chitinophagaceae bacterium]|nr:head GIN domain-containing protein [Chitinophagaceae bacterium]
MKNTFLLLLTALLAVSATAQDKVVNDPNAERRDVPSFHAIDVSGGIDLYLTQSGTEAVAVSASKEEYRDKIRTEVKNGVLKIYYEYNSNFNFSWNNNRKLKAYVSVKNIDGLEASGGSDIEVTGTLSAPKLVLDLSGGSDFKGNVNIGDLSVDASGGSDVHISGKATNLVLEASGGSDVDGYDLSADNCTADCSGGSDITITVNKELSADASGGSDIHYRGSGTVRKVNSGGGGSVKKRG